MKEYNYIFILLVASLLGSCSTNDFSSEYQKELVYDGYNVSADTIFIDTYSASSISDTISIGKLNNSTVKWYDLNGYNSMTKSTIYTPSGEHETLEQVTRDKNSLAIARDISIKSPNTETVVTLARLKKRNGGKEEWLFRYYLDAQKYIEDASYVFYTSDSRITKKKEDTVDSLNIIEVDIFDNKGRLLERQPRQQGRELAHILNFYNDKGHVDSLISKVYADNDPSKGLVKRHTESYKYELDERGAILKSYTYYNDSLAFMSEYKYALRE